MLLTVAAFLFTPFIQDPGPGRPARVGPAPVTVRCLFDDKMPELLELAPDTPLVVVEERTPWYRVRVPGGLPAWVHGDYFKVGADGRGRVTSSRVRARPRPSTGPESFPLGKYPAGADMLVLGREGAWYQVQAPESITGWVKAAGIELLAREPAGWDAAWARTAEVLTARLTGGPGPQAVPEAAAAQPAVAAAAPGLPEEAAQVEPREAAAPAPASGTAPDAPGAAQPDPGPAAVAATVPQRLDQAESDLQKLVRGPFDLHLADRLESEFGAVLWAAGDEDLKQRAQAGLARVEGLRKAYDLEQQWTRDRARYEAKVREAEASASRLEAEAARVPEPAPLEAYAVHGWVEYRQGLGTAAPFAVVRGDRIQPVEVAGGRYDLGDFEGREIAAQGVWRELAGGGRYLEITRLRVLPRR